MNIEQFMKNIEKQNELRRELKQNEFSVKFYFPLVGCNTFSNLFDLYEFINEIYIDEYFNKFTTATVEIGDEITIQVNDDIINIYIIEENI